MIALFLQVHGLLLVVDVGDGGAICQISCYKEC